MPFLFPSQGILCDAFASSSVLSRPKERTPSREYPLKGPIWTAWSAVDNVKDKAGQLSQDAAREYEKASAKAQQKAGGIELYSTKYYAACTLGGIIACVSSGQVSTFYFVADLHT